MQIYQTTQRETPTSLCQPPLVCPVSLLLPSSTSITRQALPHHHTPATIRVLWPPRPLHPLIKIACNAASSPSCVTKRIRFRREDSVKHSRKIAATRRTCLLKTRSTLLPPTGHQPYLLRLTPFFPPWVQASLRYCQWHTRFELYLPALLEDKCSMEETRSPSAQAGSVSTPHVRIAKKSGLTIKIPSLVDRLALRLVHSCNVAEQAEEEDLYYSPDEYTASESSFEGEQDYILRPSSPCSSPDRLSRRELRRRAVAPYHRTGKSRRKELWLNSEVVPAVLLSPFSSERHTRSLRSGHRY
ncbi:hypothetical protein EDB86DRAFT_750416 [Lactarius hatsudake]|nr:hypothetical protein EDB86DRAFT_750416 [Lactarius hatsudake]